MAAQQPTYQAYTVVKREGQDDFWLNIGAAFMHQDGDGFNIVLQALPIDGKIVLRPPKSDAKDEHGRRSASHPSRKRPAQERPPRQIIALRTSQLSIRPTPRTQAPPLTCAGLFFPRAVHISFSSAD